MKCYQLKTFVIEALHKQLFIHFYFIFYIFLNIFFFALLYIIFAKKRFDYLALIVHSYIYDLQFFEPFEISLISTETAQATNLRTKTKQ